MHTTCLPISSSLIWPSWKYLLWSTNYEAPNHEFSVNCMVSSLNMTSFTPIQKKKKKTRVVLQEDKRLWTEWEQAFPILTLFLISPTMEVWFITLVLPKILTLLHFQRTPQAILVILSCIQVTRHEYTLHFLSIYFYPNFFASLSSYLNCGLLCTYCYHHENLKFQSFKVIFYV
jgi:hypothetical protein